MPKPGSELQKYGRNVPRSLQQQQHLHPLPVWNNPKGLSVRMMQLYESEQFHHKPEAGKKRAQKDEFKSWWFPVREVATRIANCTFPRTIWCVHAHKSFGNTLRSMVIWEELRHNSHQKENVITFFGFFFEYFVSVQRAGNSDYILDAGRAQSNEEAVNLTVLSQMEGFAPKTLGTLRCNRDPRGQHCWSPAALHVPSLSAPNQRRKTATASSIRGELQKLASADTTHQVPSTRVSPRKEQSQGSLAAARRGRWQTPWALAPATSQPAGEGQGGVIPLWDGCTGCSPGYEPPSPISSLSVADS